MHEPSTLYSSLYNSTASLSSRGMQQPIFPGISAAFPRKASPSSVISAKSTLSSSELRLRLTSPFPSRLFSTGVRVPESRKSFSPSCLLGVSEVEFRQKRAVFLYYLARTGIKRKTKLVLKTQTAVFSRSGALRHFPAPSRKPHGQQ